MSAHMKKHPTNETANVIWHGARYAVPLEVIEQYKIESEEQLESINDVFGELITEHGEPAVLLKGLRTKEGLSQIDFAKEVRLTQQNLSAMENGRRSIGKEVAKRIAEKFGIDYRMFL